MEGSPLAEQQPEGSAPGAGTDMLVEKVHAQVTEPAGPSDAVTNTIGKPAMGPPAGRRAQAPPPKFPGPGPSAHTGGEPIKQGNSSLLWCSASPWRVL